MTALNDEEVQKLHAAIREHWLWLRAKKIEVPIGEHRPPPEPSSGGEAVQADAVPAEPPQEWLARLGPLEALLVLEEFKGFAPVPDATMIVAVLESLARLAAFRNRLMGLEATRAFLEERRARGEGPKGKSGALVDLSLDASHLDLVDKSFDELLRRARGAARALAKFRKAVHKRTRVYVGYGFEPGLHGAARAHFLAGWIQGRLDDLERDIRVFREETRGAPGSAPLGYSGTPDAKAFRALCSSCKARLRVAKAPLSLLVKLFADSHPAEPKKRPPDRARTQSRRAKGKTSR